jgi:hypothetical protein
MMLLGAGSGVTFRLDNGTYVDTAISPLDAQTTLTVGADGVLDVGTLNLGVLANYDWTTPTPPAATYYVRLAPTSGSFSGSTANVWLALSSDQSWFVGQSGFGTNSASGTLAIATDSGGTNIVASATITLTAQVDL